MSKIDQTAGMLQTPYRDPSAPLSIAELTELRLRSVDIASRVSAHNANDLLSVSKEIYDFLRGENGRA